MKWLNPTVHEPDWQLVDDEGRVHAEISKSSLGYNWYAYQYARDAKSRSVCGGGGCERSLGNAKAHAEESLAKLR